MSFDFRTLYTPNAPSLMGDIYNVLYGHHFYQDLKELQALHTMRILLYSASPTAEQEKLKPEAALIGDYLKEHEKFRPWSLRVRILARQLERRLLIAQRRNERRSLAN